jgi:hypothetical protein
VDEAWLTEKLGKKKLFWVYLGMIEDLISGNNQLP